MSLQYDPLLINKNCPLLIWTRSLSLDTDERYYYNQDYMLDKINILLGFESNRVKDNDVIYFTKYSKIPRTKFKSYFNNTIKTNHIDDSDKIIISKSLLEDVKRAYTTRDLIKIPYDIVRKYCDSFTLNKLYETAIEYVLLEVESLRDIYRLFPKDSGLLVSLTECKSVSCVICRNQSDLDMVEYIDSLATSLIKTKGMIVYDESISDMINTGSVITEDNFISLLEMTSSDSPETVGLALEIISNTNYELSRIYILFILHLFVNNKKGFKKTSNIFNLFYHFKKYKYETMPQIIISLQEEGISVEENKILNSCVSNLLTSAIKTERSKDSKHHNIRILTEVIL